MNVIGNGQRLTMAVALTSVRSTDQFALIKGQKNKLCPHQVIHQD
jgi:hypothetical protein